MISIDDNDYDDDDGDDADHYVNDNEWVGWRFLSNGIFPVPLFVAVAGRIQTSQGILKSIHWGERQ